jgi:hypothetical protein
MNKPPPVTTPLASELLLQLSYLDGRMLVVCTGSSGEAFDFIPEEEVNHIVKKSYGVHRRIEEAIEQDRRSYGLSAGGTPDEKAPADPKEGTGGKGEPAGEPGPEAGKDGRRLEDEMQELGEFLFDRVFKDKILDLLNVAIGQAIRFGSNAVIRLMIVDDVLNLIPWELLRTEGTYLCHVYDLLRHPFALQPSRPLLPPDGGIKVLFVGANPRNDLKVREQIEALKEASEFTNSHPAELISPDATHTNIADHLCDGIDVLHFLGHGEYQTDQRSSYGYFLIDGEGEQKEARMTAGMLQSFCRASPLRLAILNACRSDQGLLYEGSASLRRLQGANYYSVAHALIQAGVSCVVGMSHPISKRGGGILARRIYRVLLKQRLPVTTAMRQVRLELFAHADHLLPSDWLTPVLYSRTAAPLLRLAHA